MCRMRYTAERLRPGKALTKDLANIFYHAAKMCTCTDIFAKRSGNTREKMPRRDRQAPENPQPKIFCSYFTANLSKTLRMRQIHCACRENVIRIYYTINYHSCPLFFKRYHLLHPFLQKNTPKAACAPRALRPTFPDRKPENSPRPNAYQMNHAEKPPRLRKSRAVPCKIQPPHPLHANRAFSLLRSFFRNSAPDRCNPQPPCTPASRRSRQCRSRAGKIRAACGTIPEYVNKFKNYPTSA